jgi:signal transduction histidine kinase
VKLRTFALLLLVVASLVPLVAFGVMAIRRTEETSIAEVRAGTERLADSIARRIGAHVEADRENLRLVGAAILQARTPDLAQDAFSLEYPALHALTVLDAAGARVAGPGAGDDADMAAVLQRALAGDPASAPVRPASAASSGPFAHTIALAEPVTIAGERAGAVAARMDLIDIWAPINSVRVGRKGFVRLVAADGTLLAHGDPEERRQVFSSAGNLALVAGARSDGRVVNEQGVESLASVAEVGERGWVIVVEHPIAEALAAVRATRRRLVWLVSLALLGAIAIAVLVGRKLVRSIERLEAHTRVLASGDLDAVLDDRSGIGEIDSLAGGINRMAASIKEVHEEAQRRERLTSFGRAAAGITHDLKFPLESVRTAVEQLAAHKDDDAWSHFEHVRKNDLPRIKSYIEHLERLSHSSTGELELGEVDVRRLLDQVAAELEASPKWPEVSFTVEGSAEVVADGTLLPRAVRNLAINAAEACKGSGEVRLTAHPVEGGVEIRVADTGIGMAPEMLGKVMRAEFHTTKPKGTGLGLGVARYVVEVHGGRLGAESKVGSGTTFTMWLPQSALHTAGENGRSRL